MVCERISTLLSHFIQLFDLVLISMNLNEIERNQEGAGSRSGKPWVRGRGPEDGLQVGPASLGLWPLSVILFAQAQARSILLQWGWFCSFSENLRPVGLVWAARLAFSPEFIQISLTSGVHLSCLNFLRNDEMWEQGVVVGTHMCTNHINTRRNNLRFYFIEKGNGGAADYKIN